MNFKEKLHYLCFATPRVIFHPASDNSQVPTDENKLAQTAVFTFAFDAKVSVPIFLPTLQKFPTHFKFQFSKIATPFAPIKHAEHRFIDTHPGRDSFIPPFPLGAVLK